MPAPLTSFFPFFWTCVYNYKMEIILSTSQNYSEDNTETRTLEPIHSPVSPVLTTRSDSTAFPFVKLQLTPVLSSQTDCED